MGQSRASYGGNFCHRHTRRVSEHSSNRCSSETKGGGAGTHFTSQQNHLMLGIMILACSELCLFFAVKIGYRTRCQLKIETSILEMNQEDVTALAHHEPQVCAATSNKRREGSKATPSCHSCSHLACTGPSPRSAEGCCRARRCSLSLVTYVICSPHRVLEVRRILEEELRNRAGVCCTTARLKCGTEQEFRLGGSTSSPEQREA